MLPVSSVTLSSQGQNKVYVRGCQYLLALSWPNPSGGASRPPYGRYGAGLGSRRSMRGDALGLEEVADGAVVADAEPVEAIVHASTEAV